MENVSLVRVKQFIHISSRLHLHFLEIAYYKNGDHYRTSLWKKNCIAWIPNILTERLSCKSLCTRIIILEFNIYIYKRMFKYMNCDSRLLYVYVGTFAYTGLVFFRMFFLHISNIQIHNIEIRFLFLSKNGKTFS